LNPAEIFEIVPSCSRRAPGNGLFLRAARRYTERVKRSPFRANPAIARA